MLVTVTHPNAHRAPVQVSGPGPVEPHRERKAPVRSDTIVETGNLLGEDNEPNVIEDEEEEGEEEEALSPHVKLEQVSRDPYADLDGVFGKADEPQSAVSQVSMEDEIQQAQQQRQQTSYGSEPAKPRKNGTFRQSVAAFNQISQLGL